MYKITALDVRKQNRKETNIYTLKEDNFHPPVLHTQHLSYTPCPVAGPWEPPGSSCAGLGCCSSQEERCSSSAAGCDLVTSTEHTLQCNVSKTKSLLFIYLFNLFVYLFSLANSITSILLWNVSKITETACHWQMDLFIVHITVKLRHLKTALKLGNTSVKAGWKYCSNGSFTTLR